jgi:hypothetical protein
MLSRDSLDPSHHPSFIWPPYSRLILNFSKKNSRLILLLKWSRQKNVHLSRLLHVHLSRLVLLFSQVDSYSSSSAILVHLFGHHQGGRELRRRRACSSAVTSSPTPSFMRDKATKSYFFSASSHPISLWEQKKRSFTHEVVLKKTVWPKKNSP